MTNPIDGYTLCSQCGQGWQGDVTLCDCDGAKSANSDEYVYIHAPIQPVAKQRPRTRKTRKGRYTTHTPKKTIEFESAIASYAHNACVVPYNKDVELCVILRISQSDNRKRDIDNIIKSILDGMNGIVYHDDYQIVGIQATLARGTIDDIEIWVKPI